MNYTKVLDSYGGIIEDNIKKEFKQLIKEGEEYHPFIANLYEVAEEFVLRGGRRLGACSTLMVYKGYKNQIEDGIIKACSGVELYRHSILVHDDLVDYETLRRGSKTLHKIFEENFDDHFGVGSAIFIGDILYSLAIKAVLESGFGHDKIVEVEKLFSSDFKDVNESQILDLLFEYKEPSISEWEIMASKRASSLFRTSMLTGAILSSAPKKDMNILEDAAKHIGYAFDIQDDIIDTFASKEQYGRDPCGDIAKRKKPLHIIIALEKDRRLTEIMKDGTALLEEKIGQIQELIRDSGALDVAKSVSKEHSQEAERLISMTDMNEESKEFFVSFIKYIEENLDWYK